MPGNRKLSIFPVPIFFQFLLGALLIASCTAAKDFSSDSQSPTTQPETNIIQIDRAEISFEVIVPEANTAPVYLDIVDEVAGIPWNPLRLQMEKEEDQVYTLTIPITIGSNIKYRYVLGSEPTLVEHTSRGTPVRYRIVHVSDPTIIKDQVISWDAPPENLEVGRLFGKATDADTGEPISDVLITIAGMQTISAADGSFILEYVPVGTHQVVAYSTTGQHQTFQQGARITNNATTQADFTMSTTKFIDVTFIVTPPTDQPTGAPIRIVGNVFSFGNTFADLNGGMSVLASRAPLMQIREDGQYLLTASLPVGMDLRYSYTLGDGFWNAERTPEGRFRTRQLIVPEQDTTIKDQIITWETDQDQVFSFLLETPSTTPARDVISIQFAPFGWTEPVPLWPLGDNTWTYRLYSPSQIGNNLEYRYCRNEQCETAGEDRITDQQPARSLREAAPGEIKDQVEAWTNWSTSDQPTAIAAVKIQPRDTTFAAGVEFLPDYHPSWQAYLGNALDYVQDISANRIILDPTWSYTSNTPPVLEPVPGNDMLTADLQQALFWAKEKGMETVLFPQVHFSTDELDWWKDARKDEEWWNNWFERYERYLIHFADIAESNGVTSLIIGEPASRPSWPGGMLPDGSEEIAPANAQERWLSLINEVEEHFSGQLIWALPYPNGLKTESALFTQMDAIYLLWEAPLSESTSPTQTELVKSFNNLLNKKIQPFYEKTGKPIWIGLTYPSADGAAQGCIKEGKTCISFDAFFQNNLYTTSEMVDLQEQADIYNAAFAAINEHDWIAGVTSRGFYPPVSLKDNTYSIHGKPASDVIWYWYPRFTGTIQ